MGLNTRSTSQVTHSQKFIKRLFDLIWALLRLLSLWPVLVIGFVAATLSCRAWGIFTQIRVGRHGNLFTVYKLRTMYTDFEDKNNTVTVGNDPRITPIGRLLRKFKLDELPQLFNVVLGDMSLVGPRPDVSGYADRLVGDEREILELRPGITGPATIKYKYEELLLAQQDSPHDYNDEVIYPDKVRINLDYLRNYSLTTDISYIMMTLGLIDLPSDLKIDVQNEKYPQ